MTKTNKPLQKTPKRYGKAEIFKFLGLVAFLLLVLLAVYFMWPYIKDLFVEGGVDRVLSKVQDAGAVGVLILLGMQLLQIVVAFIPGEVTQVAAGLLYGPWLGLLIIAFGCVIASAFIFVLVRHLGAPFVQSIVPMKYLAKFEEFEESGKLNMLVFVLFLIPGLPKDTFTYLVPLTSMRMRDFMVLSNVARLPGILVTTFAASGIAEGNIVSSIVIFSVGALLAILGYVFRNKLMNLSSKIGGKAKQAKSEGAEKIVLIKQRSQEKRETKQQSEEESDSLLPEEKEPSR